MLFGFLETIWLKDEFPTVVGFAVMRLVSGIVSLVSRSCSRSFIEPNWSHRTCSQPWAWNNRRSVSDRLHSGNALLLRNILGVNQRVCSKFTALWISIETILR